jgi:hypothetical protein
MRVDTRYSLVELGVIELGVIELDLIKLALKEGEGD